MSTVGAQDGKVIPNSNISIAGVTGNSITDQVCADMKAGPLAGGEISGCLGSNWEGLGGTYSISLNEGTH